MQPRQLIAVLVALIVIVGAGLFVVSWGGDDDSATDAADESTTTTSSTTSTTTTTTSTTTTTTIPVACTTDDSDDSATNDAATDDTAAEETATDDAAEDTTDDEDDDQPIIPTLGRNSSVSTVGLDTVTFGLTVNQAEQAAGTPMIPCEPVSECYRVSPMEAPEGISFVVHEGTIERVDIASGPITTRSGLGIGTEEARVMDLFGDQVEVVDLDETTKELVFVPSDESDAAFRVIFTVRDGVVETFRSGRVPLVLDQVACAET